MAIVPRATLTMTDGPGRLRSTQVRASAPTERQVVAEVIWATEIGAMVGGVDVGEAGLVDGAGGMGDGAAMFGFTLTRREGARRPMEMIHELIGWVQAGGDDSEGVGRERRVICRFSDEPNEPGRGAAANGHGNGMRKAENDMPAEFRFGEDEAGGRHVEVVSGGRAVLRITNVEGGEAEVGGACEWRAGVTWVWSVLPSLLGVGGGCYELRRVRVDASGAAGAAV